MVKGRIYSVGYAGLDVDGLVGGLSAAGVALVVDVRLTPWSRLPGFSKKALGTALAAAGIGYRHEPDLGNPKDNRDGFRRGAAGAEEARRQLRARLAEAGGPALRRLVDDAGRAPVAVLCVESDPGRCHREVVTELATGLDPAIEVMLLR